ncbi:unnamed protein product [Cylindrotheca closterium]|uniref:Uncharacterized protein n=1 Tax=Cylindrotheca closterium TaxID=2856 RepID=A0AAD2JNM7_9STRA|nr:unnamed protein product [Cylindrotheca closterium]
MFTETFLQVKNQDCLEQVLSFLTCKELANVGRTTKTLQYAIFEANDKEGNINLVWTGAEQALTNNPSCDEQVKKTRRMGANAREHSRMFSAAPQKVKAWFCKIETPIEIRFVAGKYACKTGWINDAEPAYDDDKTPVIVDLKQKGLRATVVHTTSFKKKSDQKVPTRYAEEVMQQRPDIEKNLVAVTRQMAMFRIESHFDRFHEVMTNCLLLKKKKVSDQEAPITYVEAFMQQCPEIRKKLVAVTRQMRKCDIERDLDGFIEVLSHYLREAVEWHDTQKYFRRIKFGDNTMVE